MSRDDSPFALASAVILVQPARLLTVAAFITDLPGAAIHATSEQGKMVITLEGDTTSILVEQFDTIRTLDGVLSADLIYQHSEESSDP
ncbi:MAG: chaperone NapD [Magnetococcales bacterium]|nr:chaperone NapD [Magnetococcales bacterium]